MTGRTERHLLLTLQYRGTRYHGFQVQKNMPSIAQCVQDAVECVFKERLPVKGCSRTDAGVHARAFALTLRTHASIPPDALTRAMNIHLPEDIAVLCSREVPGDFHPRYDCTAKRYRYQLWTAPEKNPFCADLALHYPYRVPVETLHEAAQGFLGTHDFSGFCSAASAVEDKVRTITQARVERDGRMVCFSVTGDGFLYNMVRIMTGTLLNVARGALSPAQIPSVIESRSRKAAGPTAPAHGLFLEDVWYPARALGMPGEQTVSLRALASTPDA